MTAFSFWLNVVIIVMVCADIALNLWLLSVMKAQVRETERLLAEIESLKQPVEMRIVGVELFQRKPEQTETASWMDDQPEGKKIH